MEMHVSVSWSARLPLSPFSCLVHAKDARDDFFETRTGFWLAPL